MASFSRTRGTPGFLLLLVTVLLASGLVFLRSATEGTSHDGLIQRQMSMLIASLPIALVCALLPLRWLQRQAVLLYLLGLVLLVLVLVIGVERNYARRWFTMPMGFTLQPSELFRPLLILALARALEGFRQEPSARRLLLPIGLVAVPFLLVRAEPDLGTALSYLPGAIAMVYLAGLRRRWFVLVAVGSLLAAKLAMSSSLLEDYQKERVETFLFSIPRATEDAKELRRSGQNREAEAIEQRIREVKRNSGYQSHTALTSIGSGGPWGKGIGQGPQNRLGFLPERHNDFVFAVVGEEVGLWGTSTMIVLFVLFGLAILQVAATSRGEYSRLVVTGIGVGLCAQAFANMAMTLGLLPITGMPLPFISQGGSSLMASLVMVGIVVSAGRARVGDDSYLARSEPPPDPFGTRNRPSH